MTDLVEQWITALESGEYRQGTRYLNSEGEFCCLGVVSEIAHQQGLVDVTKELSPEDRFVMVYDGDASLLSQKLQEMLNIDQFGSFREITDRAGDNSLVSLNDQGVSFDEIAQVIRRGFDPNDESLTFYGPNNTRSEYGH